LQPCYNKHMIFNINEISEKLKKITRHRKRKKSLRPRHPIPQLQIRPKVLKNKSVPRIFKIAALGRDKRKKFAKIIVGNYKLNKTSAKILLALLYWSSGAKYPANNFVAFSNSDSKLVKTFLNLLRITFPIKESKIRIHLQLYTTHDKNKIMEFWSKLLDVPIAQFYKPNIKKPRQTIINRNYFGTCTVRYYSIDLLLKIMEIYEQLAKII